MSGLADPRRPDRVGLGWRGELAAGIFAHLDRIDLVELIADDHLRATPRELRPLQLLAAQRPLTLHGVALGLAGSEPVPAQRLDALARLVGRLEPVAWSEHLAFVRAGGHEIGHLAAPPRTACNVEAAARHVEQAARVVGRAPLLENIATLVEPPGSALTEAAWTGAILRTAGAPMLLDLHNLYANAVNTGQEPAAMLDAMLDAVTPGCVQAVHLSGGHWIDEPVLGSTAPESPARSTGQRLLDDHVHDVPPPVYALLEQLAARVPGPLDVVIERDGRYPAFDVLLGQIDAARAALVRGRARAHAAAVLDPMPAEIADAEATAAVSRLEPCLARLYADPAALDGWLADPDRASASLGLDAHDAAALHAADRTGLVMAARSYARKRAEHQGAR
ncbi:MAG: DUF692 domain-containing protein [Rubrivivax sp.]|nr:DUF692 domain-containing protein [Rubrivivax sp.]